MTRRFLGYSWVGWLNILIFQWFFIRLARSINSDGTTYSILKWVVPTTGWGWPWAPDYKFIGRSE